MKLTAKQSKLIAKKLAELYKLCKENGADINVQISKPIKEVYAPDDEHHYKHYAPTGEVSISIELQYQVQ